MDQISASVFRVRELRQARTAAGMSQEDLGKAISYSSSLISAVENGQRPPTAEYVRSVDRALKTGGLFERLLKDLVSIDRAPIWLRYWIIFEREAKFLKWFEPSLVPGLLQTEEYARAVLECGGLLQPSEVDRSAGSRIDRQEIPNKPTPPQVVVVVDEAVLHRFVGNADIMAKQLTRLVTLSKQSNIHIHVVPASAGVHPGLAGGFILAKGADFEAAHLDAALQAQIVDRRDHLDTLLARWEAIRGEALPRAQSVELIREVAKQWT